jgi:uncharacterized protein (TIRG00374 family)
VTATPGRAWIGVFVRLFVGLALVVVLLSFVDLEGAVDQMKLVSPWFFLVAWLVWIGSAVAHVARWRIALESQGIHVPFLRLLRLVVGAHFVTLFMPSAIGGDIIRVYGTKDSTAGVLRSTGIIFVERYCGFLGTFFLALPALVFTDFGSKHPGLAAAVIALFIVLVAAVVVAATPRVASASRRLCASIGLDRLGDVIERGSLALRGFIGRPSLLAAMLFFSVVMKAGIALQMWILARGLGIHIDIAELMIFLPLYNLATTLPISISGLGTREVTTAAFFVAMGVSPHQATTLALLALIYILGCSLLAGAALLLPGGSSVPGDSRPSPSQRESEFD